MCDVGALAAYDGSLLRRCRLLPPLLPGRTGSGHLRAERCRSGDDVAGLSATDRLAALDAAGGIAAHSGRAGLSTFSVSGLEGPGNGSRHTMPAGSRWTDLAQNAPDSGSCSG